MYRTASGVCAPSQISSSPCQSSRPGAARCAGSTGRPRKALAAAPASASFLLSRRRRAPRRSAREPLPLRLAEDDGGAGLDDRELLLGDRLARRAERPRCARARRSSAPGPASAGRWSRRCRPPSPASTAAASTPASANASQRRGGQDLELRGSEPLGRRPDPRDCPFEVGLVSVHADPLGPAGHVRRVVSARRAAPRGAASPRSSSSSSLCRSSRRCGWTDRRAAGSPSSSSSARIRSSPNPSCGQGLSPSTNSTAERIELGPVLRQLVLLGLDDIRRRVLDEALVRQHPLAALDLLARAGRSRPPRRLSAFGRGRTTASKIRCGLALETDAHAASAVDARPRPSPSSASGLRVSGPARATARDQPGLVGSCDQISSVTCGMTGCSSFNSRSSAASAVARASSSSA